MNSAVVEDKGVLILIERHFTGPVHNPVQALGIQLRPAVLIGGRPDLLDPCLQLRVLQVIPRVRSIPIDCIIESNIPFAAWTIRN